MAETELQGLVEQMKFTSEKLAEDRARHFEEQKLHSQNLEKQLLEMKEILISMEARYRVQAEDTTVVKEFSHGCTPVPISAKEPSHQVAHHVLDEMPHSTNTIEVVQIDKSSEDGGEALFEVVNWIERDEDPSQIVVQNEPNAANVPSYFTAHQVLEEMPMEDGSLKLQEMDDFEPLKVISIPLLGVSDIEFENKNGWVADSVEPIGLNWGDVLITSTKALDILCAHKLFDELPKRKTEANSMSLSSTVVYLEIKIMVDDSCLIVVDNMGLVFDPGGVVDHGRYRFDSSYAAGLVHIWSELVW